MRDDPRPTGPDLFTADACAEIARLVRLAPERVRPDASLSADLGVDSLLYMALVVGLEDHFDVTLSDREAARLLTVADMVAVFRREVERRSSAADTTTAGGAAA